jgi:hypothetical protein
MRHVKLRFPYTSYAGEAETETMWTIPREEGYEIDNIPFYVTELAVGDIVSAEQDTDGVLWYARLTRASGHSTIRLWFASQDDVQKTRDALTNLGCASEISDLPRLVAVDIPSTVPYDKIKAFLENGEKEGIFEYQEACLGNHRHSGA